VNSALVAPPQARSVDWPGSIERRFRGIVSFGVKGMAKRGRKKRPGKRPHAQSRSTRRASSRGNAIEAALAGIAHDIRTPLTGIVALAELLASSDLGTREREWANAIKSGADHLAALATLIVDGAKAGVKDLVLRNEAFSPRSLAEAVGATLAARADNKAAKAETRIARDLPAMVSGDVLRLRAALENLADNAVKFTHEGAVTFTADGESAERNRVRLIFTFADSGIGMSAAELKQLFRPFAQGSAEISRRYGGAGLGLSFVKRVANAMGGDVVVRSKKGGGSTFRLTVTVDRVGAHTAMAPMDARPVATRPLSILCAEDNPYGRVVMNTILRELGHRVDFVETGEAAIASVTHGSYDAVLMDVTLAGLNGIEAAQHIRALPGRAGQTPIIVISGHNESRDEQAAREAGMNFYFVKPISPAKLAQVLAGLAP
jgi:signal transduction histidine kinase/ActR/RegA family two-component response regulator